MPVGVAVAARDRYRPQPGLRADGLAVVDGSVVEVPPGGSARFVPGSRVLTSAAPGPGSADAIAADRRWLAAGRVPGGPRFAPLAERALLDLRSLTLPSGAALAGWSGPWRYLWPRDAAFVVAAFTATGHPDSARAVLHHLTRIAPADGRWQARYIPDGSGRAPDGRGVQTDGAGWVLWAADAWAAAARDPVAGLRLLWPMVASSADALADSLGRNGLPGPSPDYWEVATSKHSLGVAAPVVAGLEAAVRLAGRVGDRTAAARWVGAADRAAVGLERTFGRHGWRRTAGGAFDAAVTFAGPPFTVDRGAGEVLDAAFAAARNANGGVRPGAGWRRDGISWTPETALFGLAWAGGGRPDRARDVLGWLSRNTTRLGSLPEKVRADRRPASVAPLAWTCATVLLTLDRLG